MVESGFIGKGTRFEERLQSYGQGAEDNENKFAESEYGTAVNDCKAWGRDGGGNSPGRVISLVKQKRQVFEGKTSLAVTQ